MKPSTNELLLALRAPNSGWLAALICALDEALQDEDFGETQRHMLRDLIDGGSVPNAVAVAANVRLAQFERSVADLQASLIGPQSGLVADAHARPKLTLCGGTALSA